jgi:oligopeptide transport system substrate-binding protein
MIRHLISYLYIVLFGLILMACSGDEKNIDSLVAVGGKKYGGELKFMSSEKVSSLFPVFASDLFSIRMIAQIYEPLLRIDPESMEVVPGVAESFSVDKSAKVYTFKIREGITFHKDDVFGRGLEELTAEDVKFSLDIACSGLKENRISYLLTHRIKGGDEFYDKSTKSIPKGKGVSGIKVKDPYTVEITLNEPFIGFEKVMTHFSLSIVSKKAYEKYGVQYAEHPIGTGPFAFESKDDERVVLKRNNHYWKKDEFGNTLPFLEKVIMYYSKDKKNELMAFRKSEVDLVLEIPVEEVPNILGTLTDAQKGKNIKHKVESKKSMGMHYIGMACESKEFKDERVRKAFNLAINRESIVDLHLEGEGWPALNGFVPDMPGYPSKYIKGHEYNVDAARTIMREAGYPNGDGFPKLDFYVNAKEGSATHKMCQAFVSQIKKNLNVDLKIILCTYEEREEAIADGRAKIWRAAWIADYLDPENFLGMFYGEYIRHKNNWMPNAFRFSNAEFDRVFELSQKEMDETRRTELLMQCDQIIIDRAAVIPVLINDYIVMLNARVRDFKSSPLEYLDLTTVYIKEVKK